MSNNNVNFNTTGLTVGNTTISSTGDIASTANLSVGSLLVNGSPVTSGGGSGGGSAYVSSSFSASIGYSYMVDTSSSAVVATLPSAPTTGTVISFMDYNNSFGLNSFTVNPNGQTIAGRTGNLVINNSDASFSLVYDGTKWNPIRDQTRTTVVYNNTVQIGGINYVTFGADKFVGMSGADGNVWVSADGITWNLQPTPLGAYYYGQFVKYINGKFIAAGAGNSYGYAISSDGITWNQFFPPASNIDVTAGAGNGNGTIVLNSDSSGNLLLVSADNGNTWSLRSMPSFQAWVGIAYGNGVFVTAAYGGSVCAVSPDGVTWTQYNLPSTQNWSAVSFGNGVFVAITNGISGTTYAISPDGINWKQYTGYTIGSNYLYYSNGLFFIVQNGKIRTSTDGISWTSFQTTNAVAGQAAYGNGILVSSSGGTPNGCQTVIF